MNSRGTLNQRFVRASVHSTVNEYLTIDRDVYLYLDYPWRLKTYRRVYSHQGVEQLMDVTGLCKAFSASFKQGNALYKNRILLTLDKNISETLSHYIRTLVIIKTKIIKSLIVLSSQVV